MEMSTRNFKRLQGYLWPSNQTNMRQITFLVFISLASCSYGQRENKFSLLLQVHPELTFHKNDYAFRWTEKKTLATFNLQRWLYRRLECTVKIYRRFGNVLKKPGQRLLNNKNPLVKIGGIALDGQSWWTQLRSQGSNLGPSGYEPDELPLLYFAV